MKTVNEYNFKNKEEMETIFRNIPKRIKLIATLKGDSNFRAVEKTTGIPRQTLCRKNQYPKLYSLYQLIAIAQAYDVSIDFLLGLSNDISVEEILGGENNDR